MRCTRRQHCKRASWTPRRTGRRTALENFRDDLAETAALVAEETAIGRDAYNFFLKNVALFPYSPEEILAMGRQEWNRAVAFEAFEKNRNKNVPPLPIRENNRRVDRGRRGEGSADSAISRRRTAFSRCRTGCSITLSARLRRISPALELYRGRRFHFALRAFRKTASVMCPHRRRSSATSCARPRWTRGPSSCMREFRGIIFSSVFPGNTTTRSGGTTTIRARTKGSAFTRKR